MNVQFNSNLNSWISILKLKAESQLQQFNFFWTEQAFRFSVKTMAMASCGLLKPCIYVSEPSLWCIPPVSWSSTRMSISSSRHGITGLSSIKVKVTWNSFSTRNFTRPFSATFDSSINVLSVILMYTGTLTILVDFWSQQGFHLTGGITLPKSFILT